ncbi:MAG: ATP-binding protein [Hyphomicrobiales bacterium]
MSSTVPTLHLLCGKIAAGKSTLAADLVRTTGGILIAEDEWLNALFANEISTASDYVKYTSKLRTVMGPHIASLLNASVCVILDFQANTVESRSWMRGLLDNTNAQNQLHILNTPDEICLERLRERNARGNHPFAPTEEQFLQFSKFFEAPRPNEGFTIVHHRL